MPTQGYYDGVIFHRYFLHVFLVTGHMSLIDAFFSKGGSRFPRADRRQNRLGLRRRVFLRRYVFLFLFLFLALCSFSPRACDHLRRTEPFEDEIHPRLRFAHRGLVAMANNGSKNSNDSQFFITLGARLFIRLERSLSSNSAHSNGR